MGIEAWYKKQEEIGAEIDNDFGMTVKEVVELFLQEYRKFEWYEKDEDVKLNVKELSCFFDDNAPSTFLLNIKYIDDNGEEIEDSDECYHYYSYDWDDETKIEISQIEGELYYIPVNPITKKEGWRALVDVVVDISFHKKRYEQKNKISKLFEDEDFAKED